MCETDSRLIFTLANNLHRMRGGDGMLRDAAVILLSSFAGAMHVIAFYLYHRRMIRGVSVPNFSSWTVWSFLSALNCVTYIIQGKDLVAGFLPIASSLSTVLVFGIAVRRRKLSDYNFRDLMFLLAGAFGSVLLFLVAAHKLSIIDVHMFGRVGDLAVWFVVHAWEAHLFLQLIIFISFIPTIWGVWKKDVEEPRPWFVWCTGYVFMMGAVLIQGEDIVHKLVYPIHLLSLHLWIGFLARKWRGGSIWPFRRT